jgi:hypothetical protein
MFKNASARPPALTVYSYKLVSNVATKLGTCVVVHEYAT